MPLAEISTTPTNDAEKHTFDFAHQDLHRRLVDYLQPFTGDPLDAFVIDPFDVASGVSVWQHQIMHNQLDNLLHTPNYDMTQLNWDDRGSRENWVDDNYQAHQNYAQIVGFS
jgi:hypothetical protein